MPGHRVSGVHRVPGDKSITHRALMFAALADGRSTLSGALTSLDARSTASVLRRLGAGVSPLRADRPVAIQGQGRFRQPYSTLHCGNSGTTARLMLGLLAAHDLRATLTGDRSLRRRPMARVTEPLEAMGAHITSGSRAGLPITITGGGLGPLAWQLPVASAQIKSAILLAAAVARQPVTLEEPGLSRDHTERMLQAFGFGVTRVGTSIQFEPTGRITPTDLDVPGDPSSAIFLVAAALLADAGQIAVEGVGLNPTRVAAFEVLRRMGADVRIEPVDIRAGEPVGRLVAHAGALSATTVQAAEVPGLIDEIPMLACLAACAQGTTRFERVGELRVKESDRLSLVVANLRALGAEAEVEGDDLLVAGNDRPMRGTIVTHGDHRIAMAFAVLGTRRGNAVDVDDPGCAAVSFPGFAETLDAIFTTGRA